MGLGHFGNTTGTIWRVWQQKATVFGLSLWWALGAPRNLTSHTQNSLGQNLCGTSLWRLSRSLLYWLEIQLEVKWLFFFTFFPFHHEISATYLTFLKFSVLVYQTFFKVTLHLDAGFTTTVVAGLWPSLVTSLVLLNTAGKVVPDYKGLTYQKVLIYPLFLSLLSSTRSIRAFHRALYPSGTLRWRTMRFTKVD